MTNKREKKISTEKKITNILRQTEESYLKEFKKSSRDVAKDAKAVEEMFQKALLDVKKGASSKASNKSPKLDGFRIPLKRSSSPKGNTLFASKGVSNATQKEKHAKVDEKTIRGLANLGLLKKTNK